MPYKISKRPDGGIVCAFEGKLTPEENRSARLDITEGDLNNFARIPYLIADHSRTEAAKHTAADIRRLGNTLKAEITAYNPAILIALVVPQDLLFGLARMFHSYSGGGDKIGLFRTREEAEDWINDELKKA